MASAWERTHAFALTFPGAWEDHPWGEVVVKVNKKIFVFLGGPEGPNRGMTVKLPDSRDHALTLPGSEIPGYGLGKAGWVTVRFKGMTKDLIEDFIDESYRTIATKTLIKVLDART